MSEGPSRITGPIPPDPTLCPDYYRRPLSARGRLEGNSLKLDLLPGPIPPEFSLYPGCYSARCPQPPPRIKPNAKDILEKGQNGTVGVLLKLDEISFFEELRPKRRDHKDHEKENLRRMREIQRKCREKEQARQLSQPKPVKALWKSQKYENVESKVKAKLQVPENSSKVDFVSHNAHNAKRTSMQRSRSLQSIHKVLEQKQKDLEEYNTKQKGHVPHYLIERKDHWRKEAEERLRNTPDPDTPPGHAMMPENQRLETLKNLKESQEKFLKELLLLPMRVDTLSVHTRRVSLEKKLSQIEEALKIFSRPKVFIKLDS
ncbi:enkurin domain-containing protein 1 isoform X2 [Notechis scutatus]|uniref:Enkurin domain-containing protein 1 isoform X2 n=1 Tax=Notechis scutatus TaxID=8663 RepID=A0A6J1ULF0_9SAUR|nr:enkurin domain-containing protein 1 isoform X2 [Notechis scutatus]